MNIFTAIGDILTAISSTSVRKQAPSGEMFELRRSSTSGHGADAARWVLAKRGIDPVQDVSVVWLDDTMQEVSRQQVFGWMTGRVEVEIEGVAGATPQTLHVRWTAWGRHHTMRLSIPTPPT